jgi:O-antigen/teichoic acid export membrane protein
VWLAPLLPGGGADLGTALLRLALLGILLEPLAQIPLGLIQARLESTTYILAVVAHFLVRVSLCIALVRWLRWGVSGALWAPALTGAAFGLGLTARELARGVAWPTLSHLRALLRFTLPFLPGGLCSFLLNHGDRFFLWHFCPPDRAAEEVGTYALGLQAGPGRHGLQPQRSRPGAARAPPWPPWAGSPSWRPPPGG